MKETVLRGVSLTRRGMHAWLAAGACLAWALGVGYAGPGVPAVRAAQEEIIDGIVHVRNGPAPRQGSVTRVLREIWRAGGEDDEIFFGSIQQVLQDAAGNVYCLDTQLSQIQVYSATGDHLRTLGREGDGPGEARNPGDLVFLPDGTLGMVQTFPGKIVKLKLDGTPAGTLNYNPGDPGEGRFSVLVRALCRAQNTVLVGIRMGFGQGGTSRQDYFVSSCDGDGNPRATYLTKDYTINYANLVLDEASMDFVWSRVALGPQGRVYIAPGRTAYAIKIYSPDGALERVIERAFASYERDDEDRKQARLTLEAVGRNYPAPLQGVTLEDTEPDISTLWVDGQGRLWVQSSRGERDQPAGVLVTLDLFDAAGHFEQMVHLAAPGDPTRDAVYLLGDNRVVVVTGALDAYRTMQGVSGEEDETTEAAPMELICYALE